MPRIVAGRRRTEAAALPGWIAPQLTQLVDAAPEGDEWLHEIKFDGYRMHTRLDRGAVKMLTRTGLNWTHKYLPRGLCVLLLLRLDDVGTSTSLSSHASSAMSSSGLWLNMSG